MKKLILILVFIIVTAGITLNAQDFGRRGLWEIGGIVMYANNSIVTGGENVDGQSVSFFFINLPVYYLVTDGLQLGIVPEFVSVGISDDTNTDITLSVFGGFFSAAYVFKTGGSVYPFLEGRVGYNSINVSSSENIQLAKGNGVAQEVDETLSGIAWGFSGGIKVQIARGALLNFGVGYQQRTTNPEDNPDGLRNGLDVISVLAGFSVFLGR